MKTGRLFKRENLIATLILCMSAFLGLRYYQDGMAEVESRQLMSFLATSETRHARILSEMAQRRQLLRTITAFFSASNEVSAEEFTIFSQSFLEDGALTAICWTSSDGETRFSGTHASDNPCRHFDLLEPSRVVQQDPPLIVLSTYASNHTQEQQGFASVIFTIDRLFLAEVVEGLDEYLVINNTIQNTVAAYTLGENHMATEVANPFSSEVSYQTFDLATLGSVHFLYLTDRLPLPSENRLVLIISLFLLGLGGVTALYVRNLIQTRDIVTKEVAWRTAELSQFAYRTSHDIRGPLVTVSGLCRALREDVEDDDLTDVVENAHRIENHVNRLDALVGDILQLTRADLGQTEVEPVDFADLLDDIHAHIQASFADHTVSMESDIQLDAQLHLPRARIARILENLISNSVKYSNPEVEAAYVRTTVSQRGPSLIIEVKDNGLGIPEEFRDRLFTMFDRYHPDIGVQGSGLGLAIVKKHIERLNGRIIAASGPEGTTFTITLPA